MGEIADDCYDRAIDELMDPNFEDDYDRGPFVNDTEPWRPRRPRPSTTQDDFDTLP